MQVRLLCAVSCGGERVDIPLGGQKQRAVFALEASNEQACLADLFTGEGWRHRRDGVQYCFCRYTTKLLPMTGLSAFSA